MATKPITELLSRCSAGDVQAQNAVFELAFRDLRKLARAYLQSERPNHTLQPTALVNEAYLRILKGSRPNLKNRGHFFAVAARAMREVLVDHARKVKAQKRGGAKVSLESAFASAPQQSAALLALDEALTRLATWDARQAKIVEMRFFGGLSEKEIAAYLKVSQRTVKRDWRLARAWLYGELTKS